MNTLQTAMARRHRHAAWLAVVAQIDAEEAPKRRQWNPPASGKPGRKRTHGHPAAYKRHIDAGEEPCTPCIEAHEKQRTKWRNDSRERRERAAKQTREAQEVCP